MDYLNSPQEKDFETMSNDNKIMKEKKLLIIINNYCIVNSYNNEDMVKMKEIINYN